jgi:hypothetical protein
LISNIAYFILLGKLLYSTAFQTDKSAQRGQKNTACAQVDFPVKKNLALKNRAGTGDSKFFSPPAGQIVPGWYSTC